MHDCVAEVVEIPALEAVDRRRWLRTDQGVGGGGH